MGHQPPGSWYQELVTMATIRHLVRRGGFIIVSLISAEFLNFIENFIALRHIQGRI